MGRTLAAASPELDDSAKNVENPPGARRASWPATRR